MPTSCASATTLLPPAVSALRTTRFLSGLNRARTSGGAPSAIVAYGTFCAMELANLTRSGSDIGKDIRGA